MFTSAIPAQNPLPGYRSVWTICVLYRRYMIVKSGLIPPMAFKLLRASILPDVALFFSITSPTQKRVLAMNNCLAHGELSLATRPHCLHAPWPYFYPTNT